MKTFDLHSAKRIIIAIVVAIMVACSWLAPLENAANQQVDAGLKRALISFASARALNAVISVAQETEIAVQPAGMGVILAPGQLLDPVNDLVEKFADLMLIASVAFGIEKVLISIGAHWLISLALTISALGWGYGYLRQSASPHWLRQLMIVLLMTRFAIPVVVIGSDLLFQKFMAAEYQSSQQVLEAASGQVEQLKPEADAQDQAMLDKIRGWVSSSTADLSSRLEQLKQAAEQTTERIIKLMAIFVLQTLLLPIFLLWALWRLLLSRALTLPT